VAGPGRAWAFGICERPDVSTRPTAVGSCVLLIIGMVLAGDA
jgi:hypothetical protein